MTFASKLAKLKKVNADATMLALLLFFSSTPENPGHAIVNED